MRAISDVIHPKGSVGETSPMTSATYHHIHRRSGAIERLRTLTTGAAVVGLAGTAGFGVLAAATWSGTPGATSAADVLSGGATVPNQRANGESNENGSEFNGAPDDNNSAGGIFGTTPYNGGSSGTRVRPVQPGSGRSHATSGGSH